MFKQIGLRTSIVVTLTMIYETDEFENYVKDISFSENYYYVEAGTKLSAGDKITLYIPNVVAKYPNFTDGSWDVEKVEAFCEEHGVVLKIEYVSDSSYNEGAIFEQNKPEGYTIMSGTTLKIKVANCSILVDNLPD